MTEPLDCPVCLEMMRGPVTYKCGHTVCWSCHVNMTPVTDSFSPNMIRCPQCRTMVCKNSTVNFLLDAILRGSIRLEYGSDGKVTRAYTVPGVEQPVYQRPAEPQRAASPPRRPQIARVLFGGTRMFSSGQFQSPDASSSAQTSQQSRLTVSVNGVPFVSPFSRPASPETHSAMAQQQQQAGANVAPVETLTTSSRHHYQPPRQRPQQQQNPFDNNNMATFRIMYSECALPGMGHTGTSQPYYLEFDVIDCGRWTVGCASGPRDSRNSILLSAARGALKCTVVQACEQVLEYDVDARVPDRVGLMVTPAFRTITLYNACTGTRLHTGTLAGFAVLGLSFSNVSGVQIGNGNTMTTRTVGFSSSSNTMMMGSSGFAMNSPRGPTVVPGDATNNAIEIVCETDGLETDSGMSEPSELIPIRMTNVSLLPNTDNRFRVKPSFESLNGVVARGDALFLGPHGRHRLSRAEMAAGRQTATRMSISSTAADLSVPAVVTLSRESYPRAYVELHVRMQKHWVFGTEGFVARAGLEEGKIVGPDNKLYELPSDVDRVGLIFDVEQRIWALYSIIPRFTMLMRFNFVGGTPQKVAVGYSSSKASNFATIVANI
ncbi:hypothetical protein [Crucian carp herpesvirus]|uniref:ORF150 n=1 Tax=Cyprinid herpesvirus 2 TaxID=317878 RepID=A0A0E3T5K5_CYHV2|nr:hypothetical protein [Cyprinid herpesvirus 2]AMB21716.1 ORF150 [Cyprinid herpesvirus 2]APB92997.1 hypothetical protein [Crucian carp herpesvirus]QAU54868.1 protein ORF150 [Cyprinid herpesvirus 2]QIM55323.1 hypothetical protein [Cyprinid herpesvirus 2]